MAGIQLYGSGFVESAPESHGVSFDTFNRYDYAIDLSTATSVTVSGDWGSSTSQTDGGPFNVLQAPTIGTLNFDNASGVFTYTVTQAEAIAAGGSQSILMRVSNTGDQDIDFVYFNISICFVEGTLIETREGNKPINELRAGDHVRTADHGYQPIRWIGSRTVETTDDTKPVCIKKGSLENSADLMVSPLHRILISGWQVEMIFDEPEVLVHAKHLIDDDLVVSSECEQVTYWHILLDRHEIVFANDHPCETLHIGDMAALGLPKESQQEIKRIFPELVAQSGERSALCRRSLKGEEAQLLL